MIEDNKIVFPNDALKQSIVFPLYLCSKELIRKYTNFLAQYDITYTQYIVLMYFYHEKESNLKRIGKVVMLDSSTLTPLLKKMEQKKLLKRKKSSIDERNLVITITDKGLKLGDELKKVPYDVKKTLELKDEEIDSLQKLTYKILIKMLKENKNESN